MPGVRLRAGVTITNALQGSPGEILRPGWSGDEQIKSLGSLHSEPAAQTGGISLWKQRRHAEAITVEHIAGGGENGEW